MTDQEADFDQRVGRRLRDLRRERHVSQAELGGDRFSGSYVSHVESGRRRLNDEMVRYFARRLRVEPEALTDGNSPQNPSATEVAHLLPYHDLHRAFSEHRYADATERAAAAATAAADRGDALGAWSLQIMQARALFEDEQLESAAHHALRLANDPLVAAAPRLQIEALLLALRAARLRGDLTHGADLGRRAEGLLRDAAEPDLAAETMLLQIGVLMELGDSDSASSLRARLAHLLPTVRSDQVSGSAHWALGTMSFEEGDVVDGIAHHEEAEQRLSPLVDLRSWGRFHQSAAASRLENGVTDGVLRLLQTAKDVLRVISNSSDLFYLQVVEARYWMVMGEPAQARRLVASALDQERHRSAGHLKGEAELLLADIELADGQTVAAAEALARAALDFEQVGAHPRSHDAWRRHAEV